MRRLFDLFVGLIGGLILAIFYINVKFDFTDDKEYLRATIGDYYNMELLLAIFLLILLIGVCILSRQTTIINKIKKLEEYNNQDNNDSVSLLDKNEQTDSEEVDK